MAHLNILSAFFITLSLLLLLFLSSSLAHEAVFSEPLQILYGGEKLTDGDLTLSLRKDCSLVLHNDDVKVLDFNTTVDSTKHCALLVSTNGQLLLVPDNELIPTTKIGKKTYPGRYALLFVDGKLGIFGPAMWDNGVTGTTYTTPHHLKPGVAKYILFSGQTVSGSANGNVVIAENNKVSALITSSCTLSLNYNSNITVWETTPKSSEPKACELTLKYNGELVLQGHNESGIYNTQWSGGFASKENLYVCLLRYNGQILVYGLKTWLYQPAAAAAAAAIKMVVP